MSVVVFPSNTSGYSASKKRKRMPGTNGKKVREVKQVNWFNARADTMLDRISYEAINIHNAGYANQNTHKLVYQWYELPFPAAGVGYEQAIGRKVFALYARFKGYINCSGLNNAPISWRMYLMRVEDADIPGPLPAQSEAVWDLLFNNWESREIANPSADNRFICARHNFYKMVRNVDATRNIDLKVIASGTIPRMDTGGHIAMTIVGQAAGTVAGNSVSGTPVNADGQACGACIPIDIKVKLNDNYVYDKVHYYFSIISDNMFARSVGIPTGNESFSDGSIGASANFNFFTRLYFYDD